MIGDLHNQLDSESDIPLYRQLHEKISASIKLGSIRNGERLPPTRELAGELGLNRTTVSAAYALLEEDGLIRGEVGRGSFVTFSGGGSAATAQNPNGIISFASSSPAAEQFPLADFQATCREVIEGSQAANILQLGSPSGYAPLRQHLLEEARRNGSAGPDDDILITNGCQQALDVLQRAMVSAVDAVAIEDPVYHGLKNVFQRVGTRLLGLPVGTDGVDVEHLSRTLLNERPRMLLLTSSFQNPTGATLPTSAREAIAALVRDSGITLVENNIYGELRYEGEALPTLKQLAPAAIQLNSFSKTAFPGLRVGWIIAPRAIVAKLAETRQWCDLHTDQLSQAILLRFAESGRLEDHRRKVRTMGAARLRAALEGCERHLPAGTEFTRPQGGMSLWVTLPEPLDTVELLPRAHRERVDYLPGKHFAVSSYNPGTLRLSFGGLSPQQIERGLQVLGQIFSDELARLRSTTTFEAAPAMV